VIKIYEYNGTVEKVVDGDTYDIQVDLGFGVQITKRFRLSNADTPETRKVRGADENEVIRGKAVKAHVSSLLTNKKIVLKSERLIEKNENKTDFYVRYLAVVFLEGINIGEMLKEMNMVR
jgi:micrococcal nuclease